MNTVTAVRTLLLGILPVLATVYFVSAYLEHRRLSHRVFVVCEAVLVVAAATLFTFLMTYPLPLQMTNHVVTRLDGLLTTYVQTWDTHALFTSGARLLNANIYYPAKDTLALSENLLGSQLIFAPTYLATRNPLLAGNMVILVSLLLSAITMYLLVRSLTGNVWAASVAGFVYAFAPARIYQMPRPFLVTMQWTPLVILFLYRFWRTKNLWNVAGFAGFLTLQIYCSLQGGAIAILTTGTYVLSLIALERDKSIRRLSYGLAAGCLAVGLAVLPIAIPYVHLLKEGELTTLLYPVEGSASVTSYLNAGDSNPFYSRYVLYRFHAKDMDWEKRLFFGLIPLLLSAASVAGFAYSRVPGRASPRTRRVIRQEGLPYEASRWTSLLVGSVVTVGVCLVLSLGPFLHVNGRVTSLSLPYLWFSRWVPGFSVIRVPSRFGLGALFGVAVLAGLGTMSLFHSLARLGRWFPRAARDALGAGIIFLMLFDLRVAPIRLFPIQPPANEPVYRWLAHQPPHSATLELPTSLFWEPGHPAEDTARETRYEYAAAYHWQPIMNGTSGHVPPISKRDYALAARFPSASAVKALSDEGLRFVIVHTKALSPSERYAWEHLSPDSRLKVAARFKDAVVYQVTKNIPPGSSLSRPATRESAAGRKPTKTESSPHD